jgi:type II secretory pathway predicted ATPase ExeA
MKRAIVLNFNEKKITLPASQTLTTVLGESGSGKTLLMLDVAAQLLASGQHVTYISGIEHNFDGIEDSPDLGVR